MDNKGKIFRISTLAEHRQFLADTLQVARQRVIIVSPFISSNAIKADGLSRTIRRISRNGIEVTVYTDFALNRGQDGRMKKSASEGISTLSDAGANIVIVDGIHNKTLIKDSDLISEGSFNWLSAVRSEYDSKNREERTLVIKGDEAKDMIEKEIIKLQNIASTNRVAFRIPFTGRNRLSVSKGTICAIIFFTVAMGFIIMSLGKAGLFLAGILAIPTILISYRVLARKHPDSSTGDDDPYLDPEYKGFSGNLWNNK